jgi:DNA-binding beta-propeller fold protein YncE
MKARRIVGLILLAVLHGAHGQNYKLLENIPIGGEGGWDYLSIDANARKLYVARASKIVVVDLTRNKVVGEIADTPGVHGFAMAPELRRGFSSNGAEARVSVIDLITLKTITQAKTSKVVATVLLPGKPEFAAADTRSGRVFCNIEDKNEVAVIDSKTHSVIASWPLAPGEEPTGMALDAAHRRLFVGCHNKMMLMLDADTGKIIAAVPIGVGVDACAFSDGTQLAFASCGDGTLTIAKEETPDKLTVVQTLTTERGARTMALDPKTQRIYTCTAQIAAEPASPSPAAGERPRPSYVPGTFHVLVYGAKIGEGKVE